MHLGKKPMVKDPKVPHEPLHKARATRMMASLRLLAKMRVAMLMYGMSE